MAHDVITIIISTIEVKFLLLTKEKKVHFTVRLYHVVCE